VNLYAAWVLAVCTFFIVADWAGWSAKADGYFRRMERNMQKMDLILSVEYEKHRFHNNVYVVETVLSKSGTRVAYRIVERPEELKPWME